MVSLAQIFLRCRGPGRQAATPDATDAALEDALAEACHKAREAWPGLELAAEAIVQHLAERVPPDLDPIAAVQTVHAADLYLACACGQGLEQALVLFDRAYLDPVIALLSRRTLLMPSSADFKQVLAERLFTARDGDAPRIATYTGHGPIRAWLNTAAMRAALNARRGEKVSEELDSSDVLAATMVVPDPEMAVLKSQYHADFRDAFAAALAALAPEDRNLLRFRFLQGVTRDAIAQMLAVSSKTVDRQVERLRQGLLDDTRRRLADRLDVKPEELGTLMRVLQSQLGSVIRDALGKAPRE